MENHLMKNQLATIIGKMVRVNITLQEQNTTFKLIDQGRLALKLVIL